MPASTARCNAAVLGLSHGGFELLCDNLPRLPADLPAPLLVCLHRPAQSGNEMAELLNARCVIRVKDAEPGETAEAGTVYLAPGGYPLLLERDGSLGLSQDPPHLHARPAIDVLFESAALARGNRLAGALMTGASEDGAQGLAMIAACGGVTIVQQPADARSPVMPEAALKQQQPDHLILGKQLAATLVELLQATPSTGTRS